MYSLFESNRDSFTMLRPTTYASTLQMILRLFVLLRCASEVLSSASDSSNSLRIVQHNGRAFSKRSTTQECRSLADLFDGINMQDGHVIPASKINDPGLEICNVTTNSASCCTRSMEEKLNQRAVVDTRDVVANSSSTLQSNLASDARLYRDHFNELLSTSENNTRNMLTSIFRIPNASANSAVEKLFTDLTTYVHVQDHQINVRQSVNQFLDSIFPWVFTHTIDDARVVSEMTDEFRVCLSTNRKDLTPPPYGESARRLVQDMSKSVEVARSLLDAFNLAAEAVNITNQLGYEEYCSEALTRLLYCSRCEGHGDGVRPCRQFCQNVVRGCMSHVTEVNIYWNLFAAAIEKLISSLHNTYDFQDIVNSFHSRVSDSIYHYLDNAPNYHLQVITKCGYPIAGVTTEPTAPGAAAAPRGSGGSEAATTTERNHRRLLEEFPTKILRKFSFNVIVRNIGSSKNFFGKLPDAVCNSEKFSAPNSSVCWNGTAINKYLSPVPVLSLTAQVAENPELQVPEDLVPAVVNLISRLNQMTKTLHNRVIPRLPNIQSDDSDLSPDYSGFDSNNFHSGSGWGIDDTEDDLGSSDGSGSGTTDPSVGPGHKGVGGDDEEEETVTDFDFDRTSNTSSTAPPSPYRTSSRISSSSNISSSSSSTSSSSISRVQSTTSVPTSTTYARTTRRPDLATPKHASGGSLTSSGIVLPLVAIVVQRIYSRHA